VSLWPAPPRAGKFLNGNTDVYCSATPEDFGVNNDSKLIADDLDETTKL
jgi:hypothetical protein